MWDCWHGLVLETSEALWKLLEPQGKERELFLKLSEEKNGAGSPIAGDPYYGFGFGLNATYATRMTLTSESISAPRL
jgi:hypothetical protein